MKQPKMASSKMDLSLDEIVTLKKRRGSRGRGRGGVQKVTRGGGKIWPIKNKPGLVGAPIQRTRPVTERLGIPIKTKSVPAAAAAVGKPGGDLRDVLASKSKKQVVDLRAKIKPKMSPVTVGRGRGRGQRGGKMSAPTPPRRARSRSPIRKPYPPMGLSSPPLPHAPSTRRQRESPIRLPSSAETKKITVTVPGLNRPVSEHSQSMYRREEHVAATIQRSKESRHDTFLRGREEVLAQAITSALGGGGGGGIEREPAAGSGGYAPRMQMRYNRSPSSSMDPPLTGGYGGQHHAPPPQPPPLSRSKGITTMTTMTISNLSDTVSKNDIAELCGAVGSLETVSMAAPGVAEVVFKYKDDALEAFKKYNQRNLDGQPMICKLQATSRGRAMHGGGGGYGSGGMRGGYMDSYTSDFNSYSSSFY